MKFGNLWVVVGCLLALAACGGGGEGGGNNGGGGGTGVLPMAGNVAAAGSSGGGAGTSVMTAGTSAAGTSATAGTVAMAGMSGGGSGMTGAGMGGAAGTEPAGMCDTSMGEPMGTCADNATGIFGIKTVIDVWWQDEKNEPDLVDPGRDTITVYLRGEISCVKPDGSGGTGVMKACGTELPPFKSDINCDAFQITFPDELWDKPGMPTFTTTGMTTGFEPGAILTLAEASGLIGIDLDGDDALGAWPMTAASPGYTTVDHDGDMNPGITIEMGKIGMNFTEAGNCGAGIPFVFRGAPLDPITALLDDGVKAETLYIGIRSRIGGAGEIGATCDSGVGDSMATFLDSRVFACVATDGSDCETAQRDFVDNSAPNYHILAKDAAPPNTVIDPVSGSPIDQTASVGPRSGLVRLGDLGADVSCAMVRGATYGL